VKGLTQHPLNKGKMYQYHPLRHNDSIRVIRLQPATSNDIEDLHCDLIDVRLSEQPKFEAISYTWGDSVFSQTLTLQGECIKITENLASALRGFRNRDTCRYLWADAVCINQSDVSEKSIQIALMSDIYGLAQRVLVWLGEDHGNAAAAVTYLDVIASSAASCGITEIAHGIKKTVYYCQPSPAEEQAFSTLEKSVPLQELTVIYCRPWFTRLWIVQEAALARDVEIYCGAAQINFDRFAIATAVIYRLLTIRSLNSQGLKLSDIYNAWDVIGTRETIVRKKKPRSALEEADSKYWSGDNPAWLPQWADQKMLDYVFSLENKCSDARDRIYAFLGLRAENDIRLIPHYGKSAEDVYIDFAREYLKSGEIRILNHAGLARNELVSK
jgi:Heterokaryon incompatibility protein (HET)